MQTVWVLGDQLGRSLTALAAARPETHRVLMVESRGKLASKSWHVQRAHFVISSMRHFAEELRSEGFTVDYRHALSLGDGFRDHIAEFSPSSRLKPPTNLARRGGHMSSMERPLAGLQTGWLVWLDWLS